MKLFTTICTCLLLLIALVAKSQNEFVLEGLVKGYKGKVKLIINEILSTHTPDMDNEQIIYMIDGKFRFEGEVSHPTRYSIRIRPETTGDFDPRSFEYASIWIENKAMSLIAEKGNFRYCDVSGSSIQDENERYLDYERTKDETLKIRIDSLSKIKDPSKEEKNQLRKLRSGGGFNMMHKYVLDYCYSNPNSFISVQKYAWYITRVPEMAPKSKATVFYNTISDTFKQSIYGQQIKHYIDHVDVKQKLKIGDQPYEFVLPDLKGNTISLNSLKGKVVLLDFWSSGCGPCRKEHKNYLVNYKKFRDHNFEILSISIDTDKNRWLEAMQKDQMIWKSVWDADMSITKYTYLVSALPTNYLINRQGIIIAKDIRGSALTNKLNEVLDTK